MFAAVQGYYYYKAHVIRLKNLAAFSRAFATLRPAPGSLTFRVKNPFLPLVERGRLACVLMS